MQDSPSDLSAVHRRLAVLERRHRRLVAGCGVLLAVTLAAFATPRDGAETIRARTFHLVDDDDVVRGEWTVGEMGEPSLRLLDTERRHRYEVVLTREDQVVVRMRDNKDQSRLSWIVDRGTPHVLLTDADQKPRVQMTVAKSGAPSLVFIHKDGRMPAGVGIHADGAPWSKP